MSVSHRTPAAASPLTRSTVLLRIMRSEATRIGGLRSTTTLVIVPFAVILPLTVTFAIAFVSERFSQISADIQVTSVDTSNSVYWIIVLCGAVFAVVAAHAHASAITRTNDALERWLYPRPWQPVVARWLFYGAIGAAVSAVLTATTMVLLPTMFPTVYGSVDLFTHTGLRFVATVPLYTFFCCGIGVATASAIRRSDGAIAVLLAWMFLVENGVSLVPQGLTIQSYMPFLNGVFSTGQKLTLIAPWGPNGAIAYFAVVSCTLVAAVILAHYAGPLAARGLRGRQLLRSPGSGNSSHQG